MQNIKQNNSSEKKWCVIIPTFNNDKTLEKVLKEVLNICKNIIVVNDGSDDRTSQILKNFSDKIDIITHKKNKGKGKSLRDAFEYAIKKDFDYVVLLHGDGQYAPEELPKLMYGLEKNKYDVVMGSRMINKRDALKGGMPFYKFLGNITLTKIQNFLLNTKLAEFHTGYRIYSINSLKNIPFHLNTNDFHFDTEILIQLFIVNSKIKEISIPTFYGDEICHLNGIKYAFDIILTTSIASLQTNFNLKLSKQYKKNNQLKKIYKNPIMDKLLVEARKRN